MRSLALACLAALLYATPTPAVQADTAYQVEEVRFSAADGVELAGSLFVPDGEGPFPGAVIIHGSGSSDRSNVWADAFARVLARSGVATLLPDKRGSGESGGDWRSASFETLARDALAGVDLVGTHPKVDPREIGVVGLSQGGHVAPLAADRSDDVAWVVDVSGAAVPMIEQIRHEMANTARHAGLSPEGVEAILAIQRAAERWVETGEWDPYATTLDAAEGTPWAEVAAGFPRSPDSPVWTWARLNGAYDPIPHWKALDVPILVFYGAEDESDNVPVVESVRRLEAALAEVGHEDHHIRVVPGAGHGIWAPDADHSAHDHRLHPDLVEGLTAWIDARFGGVDAGDTVVWSTDLSAAVDSLVAARLEADRIPGAAVAFVVGGELVHAAGYGMADTATGRPVDFDRTLWRIGSTTKALTGLALAALAEREGIDLDADVAAWLDPDLLPDGASIKFRHLLTHSAGFDQTGLGRHADGPAPRPTLERFLREELVRVRPPGAAGVYDTYGITLAGHLIERIGGLAYPAHMRHEVFEPLGMTRTWVEAPDSARGDLAVGYGLEDGVLEPQAYEWYVTLPASSVDATAADMGRLLTALLGEGGGPISADLSRRVRSEPQLVYGPEMGAFSWAFWEERRAGRRAIHHGGIMAGYSSELYLVPDTRVGFFVAYNRDPETGPAPRLRDALTDFLHDRVLPPGESVPPPAEPLPVPSERFAGAYGNTVGCFTCDEGEGWGVNTLRFTAPEPGVIAMGERRWLAVDSTGFRGEESGARLRFLLDEEGRVRYMAQGPNSFARLDGILLDEVLGEGWEARPPAPLVALVHRANERWPEAADAYASLATRHPSNGAYAFYEGFAALNAGQPTRAVDAFERARELGKWPAWSRYYVGAAHASMGHADLALDTLETAIEEGFGDAFLLRSEPWWDDLRGSERFRALAERLGS